jgi:drug/metabolite transporter (DMT)-like permease
MIGNHAAFEVGRSRQSRILLGVILGVLLVGLSWRDGPSPEPGLWFWLSAISAFGCGVWAGIFATKPGGARRQRVRNALVVGLIGGGFLVVGGSVLFFIVHPDEIREGFQFLLPVVSVPLNFLVPAVLVILLTTLGGCVSAVIAPRE